MAIDEDPELAEYDFAHGLFREGVYIPVRIYDPDHPTFGDVIKRRVGAIDYILLKVQSIFNPD